MHGESIFFTIFLIFTGAAIIAGLALFARQSMLVAYIALGALVGPWGLGLIEDATTAQGIGRDRDHLPAVSARPQPASPEARADDARGDSGHGVELPPCRGRRLGVALAFDFTLPEALVDRCALDVLEHDHRLKLLHDGAAHRRAGEIMISVLLLQDIIAIVMLLGLDAASRPSLSVAGALLLAAALPAIVAVSAAMERWVLMPLIRRFDTIREYVFHVADCWCLGVSQLGYAMGLSHEIGAFVAGVASPGAPSRRSSRNLSSRCAISSS